MSSTHFLSFDFSCLQVFASKLEATLVFIGSDGAAVLQEKAWVRGGGAHQCCASGRRLCPASSC